MSRPDPQRDRLYEMEGAEFSCIRKHKAELRDLEKFTQVLCELAGVPVPKLVILKHARRDFAAQYVYEPPYAIEMDPQEGVNASALAHELAHHITWILNPRAEDHGPLFVLRYGQLLDLMRLLPLAGFRAICRKHGVKIARPL